jgi:hypothetical protein
MFVRYERREFDDFCQRVCELDDGILAAVLIENTRLVGTCLRSEFPVPEQSRLGNMLLQVGLIFGMAKTTENFHGRIEYVTIGFSDIHEHLFPMTLNNHILIVSTRPGTMKPRLQEKIARICANQPIQ